MIKERIGFIGFGNMAQAIWSGTKNTVSPKQVWVSDLSADAQQVAKNDGLNIDRLETILECDIVFICIKPQGIQALLQSFPKTIKAHIVSILAGTPISVFESILGSHLPISRVMPNTPAMVKEGMSVLTHNSQVSIQQKAQVELIFSNVGRTIELDEDAFHIVTALSGSGPAFFYKIALAMGEEAHKQGLSKTTAIELIAQTMIGAGKMIQHTKDPVDKLIQNVTSPGGTTEVGLTQFDDQKISKKIRSVIAAATNRSIELSK